MGMLLWVSKPLWFVLFFWLAGRRFSAQHPGLAIRPWLRGLVGGVLRALLGTAVGWLSAVTEMLAIGAEDVNVLGTAAFLAIGFGLWLVVGKLVFHEATWRFVLGFAVIGEFVGGAVDLWALHDMIDFRMC